jgi:hypothetical protein
MRKKPTYKGVEYDSNEEIEFYQWIEEACDNNLIIGFNYQPTSFELSVKKIKCVTKRMKTKTKKIEKHLLHPHKYTADFDILFTIKGIECELPFTLASDGNAVIDIKGSFNQYGGDREFSINQKWVYEKYEVYVNKVVPEKLFKATWCPALARLTPKTKQEKKKYSKCKTIAEYLNDI